MISKPENNEQKIHTVTEQKESLIYKKRIIELFEIGLNSDDIYAWHGTSWDAIQHLAEYGKLPTDGIHGKHFYYAPDALSTSEEQQGQTETYAALLAADYYVLNKLPFQVKDRIRFLFVFDNDKAEKDFIQKEVIPNGVDVKYVQKLIREARTKRKGVLITLSKRIIEDYQEEPGENEADNDRRIITQDGLPIKYITGIEPLGQYEWGELEKIQNEIG